MQNPLETPGTAAPSVHPSIHPVRKDRGEASSLKADQERRTSEAEGRGGLG